MMLDKFPVLGHQITQSLDSFITDSANSATALYCKFIAESGARGKVAKQSHGYLQVGLVFISC